MNESTNNLGCIKPDPKAELFMGKQLYDRSRKDYIECERNRIENQKMILNSLLTEKNSSGIRFPGLSIVTSRISKNKDLVTFSNGIDSLEVEINPDMSLQYLPRLSGMTHMEGGVPHGYTFDSENPDEIRTIAKVTLQLLEIRRYPEKFGYKGPISYSVVEDKLYIQQPGQGSQLLSIPYMSGGRINEISDYIDTVFKHIPQKKSSGDFYPTDIS